MLIMASLIEVLIDTLEKENKEYLELLEISKKKTPVIVKGDVEMLREIVNEEQVHLDKIVNLENKRTESVKDIATVLNKDADSLTIRDIINILKGQDEVQQKLSDIHGRIKTTLDNMVTINELNKSLIKDSIEMVEFNINLINSMKSVPEINNYTKDAYNVNTYIEPPKFDAKN